jgi:TRAP-type C4-dicarboxylate transport system substrate-binding protein
MKLWRVSLVAVVLALAVVAAPLAQARSVLRLASVVPDGSVWDKNLRQMGAEWMKASGGRGRINVFSGGSQGDEPTVVRKMNLGVLQAAALTVIGLAEIDQAFNVFSIPFFFDSYDELNYVIEKLEPTLRQRLDAKGFVLLNWGHGGWAQVFSKVAVRRMDDLKNVKLYTSAGDDRMVQWYTANGFRPQALAMTDILTGLTTGMIDGLPSPPLAALAFQWYRQTPFMLDIGIAPVVGATVVSKRAWNGLSEADGAALVAIAANVERRLAMEVPRQDAAAVAEMVKKGLTVTGADGAEWRSAAQAFAQRMRGDMVPSEIFDFAAKERTAFRQR